jgi:hypothetical protein
MRSRPQLRALGAALLVAGVILPGCGDDEQAAPERTLPSLHAEMAGPSARVVDADRQLSSLVATAGGRGPTVVVGAAGLSSSQAASGARLVLMVDGRRVDDFKSRPLAGSGAALVGACACRLDPEQHRFQLRLLAPGTGRFSVRTRAMTVIDDVALTGARSRDLPVPLTAAAVEDEPERIDARPAPLIAARRAASGEGSKSILAGQVLARRTGVAGDLAAFQIDGFTGAGGGLQPLDDQVAPAHYSAIYLAPSASRDRVGLEAATAAGSTGLGPRTVFACACRPER